MKKSKTKRTENQDRKKEKHDLHKQTPNERMQKH